MKILIDMQGLQTPFSSKRGVGAYITGLLDELAGLRTPHDFMFLFNAEFAESYFEIRKRFPDLIGDHNSHLFTQRFFENYRTAASDQTRLAELFLAAYVETLEPDVLFSPNLQEGLDDRALTTFAAGSARFSQVATLHDLVPLHLTNEYLADPATSAWYHKKLSDAVSCDKIITVSETSKRDIERFLKVPAGRVEAIPNGFSSKTYHPVAEPGEGETVRSVLKFEGDYILYFGGADQHKNLVRLVEAYAKLPESVRKETKLVLGGGEPKRSSDVQRVIRDAGLGGYVVLPGYVPQALLPALIRQARLFVFPSTHEGFGLPALEAMACGTPTIGARKSSVAEIIAEPSALFDPYSVPDMAKLIARALKDEDWRRQVAAAGLRRAQDFSWRKAAERLVEVFEEQQEAARSGGKLSFVAARLARAATPDRDLLRSAATTIAETLPVARPPRIYVDASSVAVHGGNSGIQRVVRAVCNHFGEAIAGQGMTHHVVYAPDGGTEFHELQAFQTSGELEADPADDRPVDFAAGDTLLIVDLQPSLAIRMEGMVLRLRALGVRVYYVVYDLLPVLMPEKFWPDLQREFYRWLQAVSRSSGLLCISRTVADEAAAYLGRYGVQRPDPLLIGHFQLGADLQSAALSRGVPEDRQAQEEAFGDQLKFLMVGTLEPRKGHEQTIHAFERLWAQGADWRLIIVGKQGWKVNRLASFIRNHPEFERRLFWFERASDEWLQRLYELSDCVICASEGEGFGLPLIEAARAGKPVVARDIPVFREVAAAGAFYFPNSADPAALADALVQWGEHHAQGEHPLSAEMRPVGWREATASLVRVLTEQRWDHVVQPAGAVDLRQSLSFPNPNLEASGLHHPEAGFVWTTASATLKFSTAERYDTVRILLRCFSFRPMAFRILLDGDVVYAGKASTKGDEHAFDISGLGAGGHVLELSSDDPSTPPNDNRLLGLALQDISLTAVESVSSGQWVNVLDSRVSWTGFSDVEFDWRWTLDEDSRFAFNWSAAPCDAVISLFGHAAKESEIVFAVNGRRVHRETIGTDSGLVEFPATIVAGLNTVEVITPDVRPFSSKDRRKLGMAILDFRVSLAGDRTHAQ